MEKSKSSSYIKITAVSIAAGIIVMLSCALLCAAVIAKADIGSGAVDVAVMMIVSIGALTAGYANARKIRQKGWLAGLSCGIGILCILFICRMFVSGIDFSGITLTKYAVLVIFSLIGGVIGINKREKRVKI